MHNQANLQQPNLWPQSQPRTLYGCAFIKDIDNNSSASRLFSSFQATRNKIKYAYLIEISGHHVFDKDDAVQHLKQLHNQWVVEFPVTLAPIKQLSQKDVQRNINEATLFARNTKWTSNELPSLDLNNLNAIYAPGEDDFAEHTPHISIEII